MFIALFTLCSVFAISPSSGENQTPNFIENSDLLFRFGKHASFKEDDNRAITCRDLQETELDRLECDATFLALNALGISKNAKRYQLKKIRKQRAQQKEKEMISRGSTLSPHAQEFAPRMHITPVDSLLLPAIVIEREVTSCHNEHQKTILRLPVAAEQFDALKIQPYNQHKNQKNKNKT